METYLDMGRPGEEGRLGLKAQEGCSDGKSRGWMTAGTGGCWPGREGHLRLLVGQEEPTAAAFRKELNWRGWGWGRVTGREKRGPRRYLGSTTTEPS